MYIQTSDSRNTIKVEYINLSSSINLIISLCVLILYSFFYGYNIVKINSFMISVLNFLIEIIFSFHLYWSYQEYVYYENRFYERLYLLVQISYHLIHNLILFTLIMCSLYVLEELIRYIYICYGGLILLLILSMIIFKFST